METKIFKSINLVRRGSGANLNLFRYSAMVLVLLLGIGNAWAGNSDPVCSYAAVVSDNTGQGLVYMKKQDSGTPSNPATNEYRHYSPTAAVNGQDNYTNLGEHASSVAENGYFWAMPARGFEWKEWSGYGTGKVSSTYSWIDRNPESHRATWDGQGDVIHFANGGGSSTKTLITAKFKEATKYTITYLPSAGDGNYSVNYSYLKTRVRSDGEYEFYTDNTTDNYSFTPTSESKGVYSYAADKVTLTATETTSGNFVGWFEGTSTTAKSTSKSYTYPVSQTTSVTAVFKLATLGTATGDLSPAVKALGSNNYTITVPVTAHGSWSAGDFTVAFAEQTSPARSDITKGSVTYSQTSGNVQNSVGTLTIPFTYNPASWGNTDILVTVTPVYGTAISFHILASATEPVVEEAQLWENGVKTQSGTLAAMVTAANALSTNPTVKLMQNKTIDAPLSLTKSMVFDLNDKTLTSTGTSAFSIAAQGIDVQIVDNGFSQLGTIAVSSAQSGNVSVVTFTQKAKLTMQGGTLSATNTGSGSAYGINVTQGSTFYMTNGQLTVTGVSEAQGVHVATASDYATLNGGSITVTAPSNAYGVWSAGQSNITGATIDVETTTGANAYGVYVNGGVSTLTTNTLTATAKTTGAYAAYVNAGRLNGNGGSFAATAVTSGVYGVHVQAGAEAMLQMNAVVTAEATAAAGTSVFGIDNAGTISLTNVSVTATSPTTAATAVNIASGATATTIEGGTYRANGNGSSYGLHHQAGSLNVDGGDFKAIGSGSTIYGGRSTLNATIANASFWGETQGSGNTAYGFVAATEGKNISLTNCTIKGISNTTKAYAIYTRANVTATGCTLTATTNGTNYAYGVYAEKGTNSIVNTNATVYSNTTYAYGVYHKAGSLSMEGGAFDVEAMQAGTTSVAQAYLYGLYNEASMTTTINNTEFNVSPASGNSHSQYVYGAYINGTLNSSGATYSSEGYTYAYGICGNSASTLTLSNNTISTNATNSSGSYGVYAKKSFTFVDNAVRATAATTSVYALLFDANTSEGTIADGKYYAMGNGTTDFAPLNASATVGKVKIQGGIYSTIVNIDKYLVSGYNVYNLDNEHPDFATGHRFIVADENPTPYVCYIKGGNKYTTLEAAMQYTKDNSGSNYTIIMTQDYTLPEGDYELPSNATLLVPRNADQTSISGGTPARRTTKSITVENLRLTLASGAHINVNGKIEVGGEMYCAETGQICYVCSEYGRIHMEESSLIQLNSGAVLYAWGYITGKGEIKAKNNSEVHEMFQIGDMKAMSNIGGGYYNNSQKFFFINQYYIQNIEVPTTYYYNSRSICAMASYYNSKFMGDDNVKLVGTSGALFLVTSNDESSWVRKSYDAEHDYQVWEVNSQAQLGSITISFEDGVPIIGSATFNSANYYLPITNNMKIRVLDGDFSVTQTSELLPGASVEIDKTASFTINSGKNVYVFDNDQWPFGITQVVYSPSWKNGTKPKRTKEDAAVNVHGKIVVKGGLFTTNSIADGTNATNGANIDSTNEDAGTISYGANAPSSSSINLITNISGSAMSPTVTKRAVTMESAKLKNKDESYTATAGTQSGEAFIYLNNVWQKTYTNGCFEVIGSTVYAKPSGYVALKKSQTVGGKLTGVEETNHTYLTADDKILILMDECQWWEVVATSDPTVFECTKTGYEGFYYYDNSSSKWKLKTVNVKFYSAETGDNVLKTIVTDYNGIPDQAVIATNPSKGTTAEYTYSFYGWKSSVTGTEYKWTDQLEVATADMSYRPVFTATKRNYTITLIDANNGETVYLEVPYGETPSYSEKKDPDAHYTYSFNGWSPAFTTVTGTATYTATWTSTVNEYNITWKNGNEILEVDENQPYGTVTSYGGATPTKAADADYAYTFSGWHNSLTNAPKANNETVTGEITYTAQYNTTPRYAITFNNYDGTQLDRIIYTQGETPAYVGVPTRKRDDNGYFKFIGWKNSNGADYAANVTLPTVTKKETYTAQYEYVTDLFTITLKNVHGNGGSDEWSGKFGDGSIPFYDPDGDDMPDNPEMTGNAQYSYPFDGWSLTSGGAKLNSLPEVTEDATYWALFTQTVNKYTVSIAANNDAWGSVSEASVPEVPYGTAITTSGNTLTVNETTITATPAANDDNYMYRFERWETPASVTGATEVQAVFMAYVATVEAGGNTTYHATIADAFTTAKAKTNPTITLLKDVSIGATTLTYDGANTCTLDLNGHTISGTARILFKVDNASAVFTVTDLTESKLGKLSLSTAPTDKAGYCANLVNGTLKLEAGTFYIRSTSTNQNAVGARVDGGEFIMNGGTVHTVVTQSGRVGHGIQSLGTANAIVNGGTIRVESAGEGYGMYVTGTMTVNAGKFHITGSTAAKSYFCNTDAAATNLIVQGGYFTTKLMKGGSNVETKYLAPGKSAWNYYIYDLTSGAEYNEGYRYKVAEAYNVTFKDGDNNTIQSSPVEKNTTPVYSGATPTKSQTAEYTYSFNGTWNPTIVPVTAAATYTAQFNSTPRSYTLTWNLGGGSIETAGTADGLVEYGTILTSPIVTKTGYTFAGWHNGTGIVTPSTMPAANTTYTATWTINQYTLTVLSADETMGTVTGGGDYDYNTVHTITAIPNEGYKFVEWNDHNTNASREVTVTANRTYTATFDYDIANYTVKHWKQNIANDEYTEVTGDAYVDSGTIGEQTAAVANTYPGFTAQDIDQQIIAVGGGTIVNIYYNRNPYTITFNSNGGSAVASITQNYGTDVTAPADPTREGYEFAGWSPEVPSTMPLNGETCVAQWNINSNLEVEENDVVTVSETAEVVTTIVHEGGNLIVEGGTLTTDVLIVEASASNSGQITGAGNVEVKASTGKAYFDLTLNTAARHWHAFGVPWAVDLNTDPLTEVDGDGNVVRTLTLGSHYEIVYYDTYTRATQGPNANCWKYLKHYDQVGQPIDEMTPGQGYMIAFTCPVQTVRFVKKAGAPVIYNEAVTVSAEGSGDNQGINALANPMAYHATLNAGPKVGYVHDGGEIGSDGYEEYDIDSKSFIVGKAVYIQVRSDATVEVEQSDAEQISKILAPARRKVVTDKEYLSLGDYYHVSISSATINGGSVYVLPEEDKEDKYVVGHDLAKFGMSTKKPQIWVNRYGVNLGLNTVAPINETAEFPVNLYTPTAGEYTITNNQSPMTNDEYIVYLTQNGEAIWNLSDAPYAISLPAGVNKTYGLRLTARKSPTIATGVDEAVVDAKNEIRKVLIEDKVFIIREGNVYSIDGQLVK